jgi:transcriptional regulator with XRE-family HTH domain
MMTSFKEVLHMDICLVKTNLRSLRRSFGVTQWKLSLGVRIRESRLSNLENGAPPREEEIRKLCEFFSVRSNALWPGIRECKEA